MAHTSTVTLVQLPTELLLQIIKYVDDPSTLALSQSNKLFRTHDYSWKAYNARAKGFASVCPRELGQACAVFYLAIKMVVDSSRYQNYFACSQCLKLRFRDTFADKQIKAKRGKGHAESDRRFCIDCGVNNGIYQPGQAITNNGNSRFVCAFGRHLCDSGFYCTYCGACQPCLERKGTSFGNPQEMLYVERNCPRCSRYLTRMCKSGISNFNNTVKFPIPQDLFLTWKMAEFQDEFGMMASPEWYEENIAHGNF